MEYSDDADASWKSKGKRWTVGDAGIVTTDEEGLVEAVSTRTARGRERTRFPEVLEEAEWIPGQAVLVDKGVGSRANRAALKARGLRDGVMRRKPKGKPMTHWNRVRNRLIPKRRFVVERTFGTLKGTVGLGRTRYPGLDRVHAEVEFEVHRLQSETCEGEVVAGGPVGEAGPGVELRLNVGKHPESILQMEGIWAGMRQHPGGIGRKPVYGFKKAHQIRNHVRIRPDAMVFILQEQFWI